MKIVINRCFGGFSISRKAEERLAELQGKDPSRDRTDKNLIKVVEELGNEANGRFANLKIIEIPDGVEWEIDDYDGVESIHEKHRSWS